MEGLENTVSEIREHIEKATSNATENVLTVDRKNPGNRIGFAKSRGLLTLVISDVRIVFFGVILTNDQTEN